MKKITSSLIIGSMFFAGCAGTVVLDDTPDVDVKIEDKDGNIYQILGGLVNVEDNNNDLKSLERLNKLYNELMEDPSELERFVDSSVQQKGFVKLTEELSEFSFDMGESNKASMGTEYERMPNNLANYVNNFVSDYACEKYPVYCEYSDVNEDPIVVEIGDVKNGHSISMAENEIILAKVEGKSVEIKLLSVAVDKILISINGETSSIDEMDEESIGDFSIKVTEVVSSSRDSVKGYATFEISYLFDESMEVSLGLDEGTIVSIGKHKFDVKFESVRSDVDSNGDSIDFITINVDGRNIVLTEEEDSYENELYEVELRDYFISNRDNVNSFVSLEFELKGDEYSNVKFHDTRVFEIEENRVMKGYFNGRDVEVEVNVMSDTTAEVFLNGDDSEVMRVGEIENFGIFDIQLVSVSPENNKAELVFFDDIVEDIEIALAEGEGTGFQLGRFMMNLSINEIFMKDGDAHVTFNLNGETYTLDDRGSQNVGDYTVSVEDILVSIRPNVKSYVELEFELNSDGVSSSTGSGSSGGSSSTSAITISRAGIVDGNVEVLVLNSRSSVLPVDSITLSQGSLKCEIDTMNDLKASTISTFSTDGDCSLKVGQPVDVVIVSGNNVVSATQILR